METFESALLKVKPEVERLKKIGVDLNEKQKVGRRNVRLFLIVVITAAFIFGIFIHGGFFGILGLLVFMPVIFGDMFVDGSGMYRSAFKAILLPKFAKSIHHSINNKWSKRIPTNLIYQSQVLPSYAYIRPEDHFYGNLDGVSFRFSEITFGDKDIDDEGRATYLMKGTGVFFYAKFPKSIQGRVFIRSSNSKDGGIFESKNFKAAKLERFEDPVFEKEFDVYSDDPIEARYILSSSLMSEFIKLKRRVGMSFHISFIKDRLHIYFPSYQDRFEVDYNNVSQLEGQLKTVYNQIVMFLMIIPQLKLERRLWDTK